MLDVFVLRSSNLGSFWFETLEFAFECLIGFGLRPLFLNGLHCLSAVVAFCVAANSTFASLDDVFVVSPCSSAGRRRRSSSSFLAHRFCRQFLGDGSKRHRQQLPVGRSRSRRRHRLRHAGPGDEQTPLRVVREDASVTGIAASFQAGSAIIRGSIDSHTRSPWCGRVNGRWSEENISIAD